MKRRGTASRAQIDADKVALLKIKIRVTMKEALRKLNAEVDRILNDLDLLVEQHDKKK